MMCASASVVAGNRTEELYSIYCSSCHGVKNAEAPEAFNASVWKKRLAKGTAQPTEAGLSRAQRQPRRSILRPEWTQPPGNRVQFNTRLRKLGARLQPAHQIEPMRAGGVGREPFRLEPVVKLPS